MEIQSHVSYLRTIFLNSILPTDSDSTSEISNFGEKYKPRVLAKFKAAMDQKQLEQNEEEFITNKNDMDVK